MNKFKDFYVIHRCHSCGTRHLDQEFLSKCPECGLDPHEANEIATQARVDQYAAKVARRAH